jgi:PAS domain S-box-containing protein
MVAPQPPADTDDARALRAAANDFETAVHGAFDAVIICHYDDRDAAIVDFVNPAFTEMTLFEPAEIVGQPITILYGPKTNRGLIELSRRGIRQGERVRFETVNYRKDGSEFWVEVTTIPLAGEGGYPRFISVRRDTTERHRLAEHLAWAQRLARIGSFDREIKTGVGVWSAEMYRLFGRSPEEPAPSFAEVLEQVEESDRERVRRYLEATVEGASPPPQEFKITSRDGALRTVYSEYDYIRDDQGRPTRVVGILRDVTEMRAAERRQKDLEMQLLHAHRLDALGTLAGGIAHELNNMLVPLLGLSKATMARLPEDSLEYRNLETISGASRRARDLVRQILDFARKETPKLRQVELGGVVLETMRMLRLGIPSTIAMRESVAAVPAILGDPGKLSQVIVNLVTNAMQAIGRAPGAISVEVWTAPDAPAEVRLAVRDTGPGMDEATRQRVFEPFFTTKPVGEGTGLGLSVVHGIVAEHSGRIEVATQPGDGATFTIIFPAAPAAAQSDAA